MRLIIGGRAQGKLDYLLAKGELDPSQVLDGASCPLDPPPGGAAALDHLHLWVRRALLAGRDPLEALSAWERARPEIVFLCDEVGCGVVPLDPFDRVWRESVGRLCCRLAARAARVERVFCGVPTILKEEH